jgi:hypothetical protein
MKRLRKIWRILGMKYELEEIKEKVNIAIDILFKNDSFLLENDVNERSISHKLAEYLQILFPKWHVDCEYNRMKSRKMDKKYITKTLNLPITNLRSEDTDAKTVYPDIVVHKRGTDSNLLAIEIKKKSNNASKDFDYKKLKAFTSQLRYTFGLFIEFDGVKVSNFEFP